MRGGLLALSLLANISGQIVWFPFSIQTSPLLAFVIWIGNFLKRSSIIQKFNCKHYICIVCVYVAFALLGYSNISYVKAYINDYFICLVTGLLGSLIVIRISHIQFLDRFGEIVGRNTLYILCAHLIVINRFQNTLMKLDGIINNKLIYKLIFVSINIILPVVMVVVFGIIKKKIESFETGHKANIKSEGLAEVITYCLCLLSTLIAHNKSVVPSICIGIAVIICGMIYKSNISIKQFVFLVAITVLYDVINLTVFKSNIDNILSILVVSAVLVNCIFDRILKNELYKGIVVFAISFISYLLLVKGQISINTTNSVFLFYIGKLLKDKKIVDRIMSYHFSYFVFSTIFVYEIYRMYMNLSNVLVYDYSSIVLLYISGLLTLYHFVIYVVDYASRN